MKWCLPGLALVISSMLNAQIVWDGGGDGNSWNDADNWSTNTVPAASDNVVLDNNSGIAGSYIVVLPPGAVTTTISSLLINPTGTNTITLHIPVTNTANPGLRINGAAVSIVLNNNAILQNSTGAAAGGFGLMITGTFRINNGGRYIHNNERGHAALVSQLSAAAGTELGIFEFNVPTTSSFTISAAGQTYGTVILNAAASGATKTYSVPSAGSPLNIRGNLQINQNTNFTWSAASNLIVHGNLFQQSSSNITLGTTSTSPAFFIKGNVDLNGSLTESTTGNPVVELNGTNSVQHLHVSGTINGNNLDFIVNNPMGVDLMNNLVLPYRLSFAQGNLTIGNYNLTCPSTTGGAAARHVITNGTGKLIIPLIGPGTIIFPVGTETNSWNPVAITNGGGAVYAVSVADNTAPPVYNNQFAVLRTWHISASATVPTVMMAFEYSSPAQTGTLFTAAGPVQIGYYISPTWNIHESNLIPSGGPTYQVSTSIPFGGFSPGLEIPFVIGNHGAILSAEFIINCRAKRNNNSALVSWQISDPDDWEGFEIQRATNNNVFLTITRVDPAMQQTNYSFTDPVLSKGANLYRIKAKTKFGSIRYSNTVTILHETAEILITSVDPNPVQDQAVLVLSTTYPSYVSITVYDMAGKVCRKWSIRTIAGTNDVVLDLTLLPAGIYQVFAATPGAKSVFRILKQ